MEQYTCLLYTSGVGIVVAAGVLAAEAVGAAAGTDALDLVGGHADAHAGAAEEQRLAALPLDPLDAHFSAQLPDN